MSPAKFVEIQDVPTTANRRTRDITEGAVTSATRILSISQIEEDQEMLRRILSGPQWDLSPARDCREAIAHLTWQRVPLVICDQESGGGSWRDILEHGGQYPESPLLIVTSRNADDHLWAEVLNLGGQDVLSKPFCEQEVRYVLSTAWRYAQARAVDGVLEFKPSLKSARRMGAVL